MHATLEPSLYTSHQTLIKTMKGMECIMQNPKSQEYCTYKTKGFFEENDSRTDENLSHQMALMVIQAHLLRVTWLTPALPPSQKCKFS